MFSLHLFQVLQKMAHTFEALRVVGLSFLQKPLGLRQSRHPALLYPEVDLGSFHSAYLLPFPTFSKDGKDEDVQDNKSLSSFFRWLPYLEQ